MAHRSRPTLLARLAPVALAVFAALAVTLIGACEQPTSLDGGSLESGAPSSDTTDDDKPGAGEGIPCEIDLILQAKCQGCHADKPIGGAPMSLLTWEDLHASAVTKASVDVYELSTARIVDDESPMPPASAAQLTAEERKALLDWLGAGAPKANVGAGCGDVDPQPTEPWGVDSLGCKPDYVFTSHAAGKVDAPFELPPDAVNSYFCFGFKVPWGAGTQATAMAPILGDDRVVHHAILYTTSQGLEHEGVFPCESMPADTQFLAAFQPTAPKNLIMPDDVGLELPDPGQWVFMQVHYWNAAGLEDVADQTGLAFCTTEEARPQAAGILWLGTVGIFVPPYAEGVTTSGCWTAPSDLNIMASGPHMHKLGKKFRTELHRTDGSVDPVIDIAKWDFENQEMPLHEPVIPVSAGDTFRVSCTYDNPTAQPVFFGERTEDEMCFDFTLVYPIDKLGANRRFWTPCL